MGFFGGLFGKKTEKASGFSSRNYSIDIRDDCFVINGSKLDLPIHIEALAAVLGKPRAVSFKTKAEDRAFLEKLHSEPVTNRVNYTWDELGLMCYTYNGKVVNTFGICIQPQTNKAQSNPKSLFEGVITMNGQPWLPIVKAGKDCEVMREVHFGSYLISAEYTDFMQDDITRDETSFTGLEIQLEYK